MTGVLADIGHAPWQLVLIAVLYLSLAAGLGVGMMVGRRNQQPTGQDPGRNNGAGRSRVSPS